MFFSASRYHYHEYAANVEKWNVNGPGKKHSIVDGGRVLKYLPIALVQMPLTLKSPSIGKAPHAPSTFLCPSCWFRNAIYSLRGPIKSRSGFQARRHPPPRRHATTSAPVSPVNAHRELPPPFRELRETLSALQNKAAAYVNAGQLQLALRGVESENPVTRVAGKKPLPVRMIQHGLTQSIVLGLNGHQGASRLTRALLADPLNSEPEWEKQLLIEADGGDGKALLLR